MSLLKDMQPTYQTAEKERDGNSAYLLRSSASRDLFSVRPEGENVYILAKMPQLSGLKTIYNHSVPVTDFSSRETLDCYHRS